MGYIPGIYLHKFQMILNMLYVIQYDSWLTFLLKLCEHLVFDDTFLIFLHVSQSLISLLIGYFLGQLLRLLVLLKKHEGVLNIVFCSKDLWMQNRIFRKPTVRVLSVVICRKNITAWGDILDPDGWGHKCPLLQNRIITSKEDF